MLCMQQWPSLASQSQMVRFTCTHTCTRTCTHTNTHVHACSRKNALLTGADQLVQLLVACARVRHYDEGLLEDVAAALHAHLSPSPGLPPPPTALPLPAPISRTGSSRTGSTSASIGASNSRAVRLSAGLSCTQLAQLMWAMGYLGAGVLMQARRCGSCPTWLCVCVHVCVSVHVCMCVSTH